MPLNATFNPHNRDEQRLLNYSAIFDEVEDFEAQHPQRLRPRQPLAVALRAAARRHPTRSLFDPNHGLLIADNDINQAPCIINNLS